MEKTYKKQTGSIQKGDIIWVRFKNEGYGLTHGTRPALVVGIVNDNAPMLTVMPMTHSQKKIERAYPTHVIIDSSEAGLDGDAVIMTEQITTVSRNDVKNHNVGEYIDWNNDNLIKQEIVQKIAQSII